MIAAHNLQRVGISKYCRSIEAAGSIPATQRRSLRAESAQDVLASSFSSFRTLEQRMGIRREQKEQKEQKVEVSHGHS
jgi:hypothetical protein